MDRTHDEREALRRQSHPVHGDPGSVQPGDVTRLFDECHRLLRPDHNARTESLDVICSNLAVVRNLVCGGETAFRLVEGDWGAANRGEEAAAAANIGEEAAAANIGEAGPTGEERDRKQLKHHQTRVARLLAVVVDTYFDVDDSSNTKEDAISLLLEEANVALLAKARRLTCQVIVNACSSSAWWRASIAASMLPKRYTCLVLTDDVRVVGSLAYSLHTMINIDRLGQFDRLGQLGQIDLADGLTFGMAHLVQLIALMLQVDARYGEHRSPEEHTQHTQHTQPDPSLEILLTHLCLRRGALKAVVLGLCFQEDRGHPAQKTGDGTEAIRLNSNHVYLFDALVAGAANDPHPPLDAPMAFLLELVEQVLDDVACREDGSQESPVESMVIRGCLHLWRDAMANPSGVSVVTTTTSGVSTTTTTKTATTSTTTNSTTTNSTTTTSGISTTTVTSAFRILLGMLRRNVHIADALSVIANACHRRPAVQACLLGCDSNDTHDGRAQQRHDTLCLILGHAQGNPDAPLAREWALLAIRNLCECSQEARDAITALEKVDNIDNVDNVQGPAPGNPRYTVEYDASAGGWKLGVPHAA